jgi:tetratricopeptide (TPR) repeat protein
LTQSLHGLGGVGKTQLAVEYAYRHATDYGIVWWIRSEKPETLASDYAALAAKLELPERDAREQPVIIQAVRAALAARNDWLLIFDNANTADEIRAYLPSGGGHIIITSRDPAWRGLASLMPVQKWQSGVAVEFLIKRTGKNDSVAANELAKELDYLPLALEQAGAYIESTDITLARYLELFRKHHHDLLKSGRAPADHPESVETTWELAFQQIEKASPAAADLLNLCSFFAPDDIPRDMIVSGAEHLPEPLRQAVTNELTFNDAVSAIRRYSLFETRGDEYLSMHRLVQSVVRNRFDEEGKKCWAVAAAEVVNKAFPFESGDIRTWKKCALLTPHGQAASSHSENLDTNLQSTVRLLNQIGVYLNGRAEYAAAKVALERAIKIGEKSFGKDHPKVATMVNNLGIILEALGDMPAAKVALERALKIGEKAFGADHPDVATSVNNLGIVSQALGDLFAAKAAFEQALKIDEKAFGADHPAVAIKLNNLGSALHALGDLPAAKTAFERALKIDERTFGPDHPDVAIDLNNLGLLLRDLGDLPAAKAAFDRTLKIDEKAFGPDHPKVAIRYNNLGNVSEDWHDLPVAKAAYERALAIFQKSLGEEHPNTLVVQKNLESVLKKMNQK